jgi:hypothetical protein
MRKQISDIAREELELALSHNSKPTEAIASLMAHAKQDPELYYRLTGPHLKEICRKLIEAQKIAKPPFPRLP